MPSAPAAPAPAVSMSDQIDQIITTSEQSISALKALVTSLPDVLANTLLMKLNSYPVIVTMHISMEASSYVDLGAGTSTKDKRFLSVHLDPGPLCSQRLIYLHMNRYGYPPE